MYIIMWINVTASIVTYIQTHPPMTADGEVVESYCTVLYCLSQCLAKVGDVITAAWIKAKESVSV